MLNRILIYIVVVCLKKMIDGVYVLCSDKHDLENLRFSPKALGRNTHSWAHFAVTIGAYKMPMTNLLGTFLALSSASRPG